VYFWQVTHMPGVMQEDINRQKTIGLPVAGSRLSC